MDKYTSVSLDLERSADHHYERQGFLSPELDGRRFRDKAGNSKVMRVVQILMGSLFLVSYGYLLFQYNRLSNRGGTGLCAMGYEDIYVDPPIGYEMYPFHRAGFPNPLVPDRELTAFEGPRTPETDAAWDQILSVGMVAISETENDHLPSSSASLRSNPHQFVVQIEMFHQLHCLKWLRNQLWDFEENRVPDTPDPSRVQHWDHCIDYLRQVVMCHGDLTPVIHRWHPDLGVYSARHETIHQCRNFERIFDWAASRNHTGLRTDGKHSQTKIHMLT